MKKVIKKVVAKAPVKKTVAKKPMMKSGGVKKPLVKAQYGDQMVNKYDQNKEKVKDVQMMNAIYPKQYTTNNAGYMQFTPSVKPEPSAFQNMRRNVLTKRINNLDEKGIASQVAGNKEKARRQFDKSDSLHEKRSALREKAGYKKGGAVKKVTAKKIMVKSKKK